MSDLTESQAATKSVGKAEWEQTGPPDIEPGEIVKTDKLGEGQFGTVFRGTCRGKEVAIKELFKQDLDEEVLADFKKEVEIMARLRHPNVLLFMGACTTPGHMALVTEILPRGNVEELLEDSSTNLSLYTRIRMLRDVAQGMNWLHESKPQIIHRDLKPANLLVDEAFNVKVCDFGLSAVKENKAEKLQDKDAIPGTPLFLAPEVLMGKPFDSSSDVYSFAITMWEMYTKKQAFSEFSNFGTFKRAVCFKGTRPPLPEKMPPRLRALFESCWHKDATVRPDMGAIIKELEAILVDIAIPDKAGNTFWNTYLKGRTLVSWDTFSGALCKALNLGSPNTMKPDQATEFKFFRYLVGQRQSGTLQDSAPTNVSLESFGNILQWFGPFDSKGRFLTNIRDTMQATWFHGPLSSKAAEKSLSNRKKGTFIVRLSATQPGTFSISRVGSTGISHQRITFKPSSGFHLKFQKGKNVKKINADVSLVAFVTKHISKELKLSVPCSGSPYGFLYGESVKHAANADVDGYEIVSDSDSD